RQSAGGGGISCYQRASVVHLPLGSHGFLESLESIAVANDRFPSLAGKVVAKYPFIGVGPIRGTCDFVAYRLHRPKLEILRFCWGHVVQLARRHISVLRHEAPPFSHCGFGCFLVSISRSDALVFGVN